MKAILKLKSVNQMVLEIHSENDVEAIALTAWQEKYANGDDRANLITVHNFCAPNTASTGQEPADLQAQVDALGEQLAKITLSFPALAGNANRYPYPKLSPAIIGGALPLS